MNTARDNALWATTLVDGLVAAGVRHAALSPGSRHTPIVLALERLADEGRIGLHTILDERSAAFFALGLARASSAPALVACTSGSAAAHHLPAVIEADRARIPLLILSADRPPELQGVGAPQTIDQTRLFGEHVRASLDPGAPTGDTGTAWIGSLATRAVGAATGERPGPVHLNLPFRKPLWDGQATPPERPSSPAATVQRGHLALDETQRDAWASNLASHERGIFVVGPHAEETLEGGRPFGEALGALSAATGWPVLADGVGSVRWGWRGEAPLVACGDGLVRSEVFVRQARPDLVVRFGAIPTSAAVRSWLAEVGQGCTWLVDGAGELHDPEHVATQLFAVDPTRWCMALAARLGQGGMAGRRPWTGLWRDAENRARLSLEQSTTGGGLWSGAVVRSLIESLPDGALLHVASSLPVRDLDSYGLSPRTALQVTAHRGACGIDGTLSTALGEAAAWTQGPVAVLLGDLAFLHDVGALVTAQRLQAKISAPVTAVVVDNGGGGIFDQLPIASHPTAYERHFLAAQGTPIPSLCEGAGIRCLTAEDPETLRAGVAAALERPGLDVVYAAIDRKLDRDAREQAWGDLRDALDCPGLGETS